MIGKFVKKILNSIFVLCLFLFFLTGCGEDVSNTDLSSYKSVFVTRVVDGDTFIYKENGEQIRVRMIGIDTPESVAPEESGKDNTQEGIDASAYTKSLIEGKAVYLEYDAGREDKYGRELAYVYLSDGRMVQDILLSEGYAKIMTIQPNIKYAQHFLELEEEAEKNGVGFWNGYFNN